MKTFPTAVFILVATELTFCKTDEDNSIYSGHRAKGTVRLYYPVNPIPGWNRHPGGCYGLLIQWQTALFPCSCVAFPKNYVNHRLHQGPGEPVFKVEPPGSLKVGLMWDEVDPSETKRVAVAGIDLSPRCDSSYKTDFALLNLDQSLKGSKLIKFYTLNPLHMTEIVSNMIAISSVSLDSKCFLMKWDILEMSNSKIAQPENIPLQFSLWELGCQELVCPPNLSAEGSLTNTICEVTTTEYCMGWARQEDSLCDVLPGSPVFCELRSVSSNGRKVHFNGVIGFMNGNSSCHCDYSTPYGVMTGITEALSLIQELSRAAVTISPLMTLIIPSWVMVKFFYS